MTDETQDTRQRVVEAALDLLREDGREAVSTRAICEAAGIQPPTIYRQFGDMQGLLDAVAERGLTEYVELKTTRAPAEDPVEDLRRGWDLHVGFGLANPGIYALMYGDPRPGRESPAARQAESVLEDFLRRVAAAGRLRVSVERAASVVSGAGRGVTLNLISTPIEERDLTVAAIVREAVFSAITTDENDTGTFAGRDRVASLAVALRETLEENPTTLSPAERGLLAEWLDRLSATAPVGDQS